MNLEEAMRQIDVLTALLQKMTRERNALTDEKVTLLVELSDAIEDGVEQHRIVEDYERQIDRLETMLKQKHDQILGLKQG